MTGYPGPITELVKRLSKLPGIGEKSAMRMALYLLDRPEEEVRLLGMAIAELKERITFCSQCHTFTDRETCSICEDPRRDRQVICVVEEPGDLLAVEQAGYYRGLYHVLHGVISPLDGVGPENLKIDSLMHRAQSGAVKEIILATNPTVEGEATAHYLFEVLKDAPVLVSRIASGLPVGGDVKFADTMTLKRALEGRSRM
jgi:recombination protein RecR